MADGFWNRQQPILPSPTALKRLRPDYDLPISGLQMGHEQSYLARDDDHGGLRTVKDTESIGSAYDRYLQSAQTSSLPSGGTSPFAGTGSGMTARSRFPGLPLRDPTAIGRLGAISPNQGRNIEYDNQLLVGRETVPLPADATNTLYVEGLPSDCTRREVAHIFRPFVGYKELRLVSKDSKHRGRDPLILCFVDFMSPACAATAMSALQGYKMDEQDPDSNYLRLQFSRYPGPRSSSSSAGSGNKR